MSRLTPPPADVLLEPWEWYLANWRHLPPLVRPAPAPFDREQCLERLARVKVLRDEEWNWTEARLDTPLGAEEGLFWLEVFTRLQGKNWPPNKLVDFMRKRALPEVSEDELFERSARIDHPDPGFICVLASLLEPARLVACLLHPWTTPSSNRERPPKLQWRTTEVRLAGFRRFIRPYLTPEQHQAVCQLLAEYLASSLQRWRVPLPSTLLCLMASAGMAEELKPIIQGWHHPWLNQEIAVSQIPFVLFGLDDPMQVAAEFERLRLRPSRGEHVRGLLAHLGVLAVPIVMDAILTASNRAEAEALTPDLGCVRQPATARVMLELAQRSRAPAAAQRWLDDNRPLAIPGLLRCVLDEEFGKVAIGYLRDQVRAGRQELIETALAELDAATVQRVRRELETTTAMHEADETATPGWFPPPRAGRAPRMPSWLDGPTLPPLRLEGKRLSAEAVTALLLALKEHGLDEAPPWFALVKKYADPRLLDAFVWSVFERWYKGSSDARDKWALSALGHLGGDGVCLPLMALVAGWPGKSQHLRAVLGLQCLQAIGTDLALTCIWRLMRTSRFTGLQMEAESRVRALAASRQLTVEQFEDRIVPRLKLDRDGYRPLDCSGHAYRLTLGPDRQARLLDEKSRYLEDLPALAEEDDPVRVEAARAEWELFRLQSRELMQFHDERLEQAMLGWRRWPTGDFLSYLVQHPLLNHLARAVLWAVFSHISKVHLVFRVTEGRRCVDASGAPLTLEPGWQIGVVHPVLLSAEERLIWNDVMQEQGWSLPAWQLSRKVHDLEGEEKKNRELSRWQGRSLELFSLYSRSTVMGWQSGPLQRNRLCCQVRYNPILDLTVYLLHTPLSADMSYLDSNPVEVTGCQFRRGDTRTRVPNQREAMPLGEVDPVLLDEVIAQVNELMG